MFNPFKRLEPEPVKKNVYRDIPVLLPFDKCCCPKCGAGQIKIYATYIRNWYRTPPDGKILERDEMVRKCSVCDYKWLEMTYEETVKQKN